MYPSIPVGHSATLKEKHDAIKTALQDIKYEHHQWVICVDLKMVIFWGVSRVDTQSFLAFYATGTAGIKQITEK